uniref:helix-turn-helix domain-containing protein n=1 Tax=Chitiniphilus eburneus TaxID=2571148 RepID=UPI001B7FB58C
MPSQQRAAPQSVPKWRAQFVELRLDGLLEAPRSGAPRTIEDAKIDTVIAKTLESAPEGATHWSKRSMAREAALSQSSVSRIWRTFGLAAASAEDLQTLQRSVVRREGPRHRRPVSRSAAYGHGAVCGREEPDSGAQKHIRRGPHRH